MLTALQGTVGGCALKTIYACINHEKDLNSANFAYLTLGEHASGFILAAVLSTPLWRTVGEIHRPASICAVVKTSIGRLITHILSGRSTIDWSYSSTVTNREKCGPFVLGVNNIHILSLVIVLCRDGIPFYFQDLQHVVPSLAMQ